MLTKRRFWKVEQKMKCRCSTHFQGCENSIWAKNPWKMRRTSAFHLLFRLPKSSFGEHKVVCLNNQHASEQSNLSWSWINANHKFLCNTIERMGLKNNQDWEFDKDWQSCCHHLVISTDTSSRYHNEMSTNARSFNTTRSHAPLTRLARTPDNGSIEKNHHAMTILWFRQTHRHAIIILWLRQTNRLRHSHAIYRHIVMLSSSCEFHRRIVILSSYCEFYRNIVMLSSSCELDTSPCYQNEKLTNARAPAL